jgi:hypothetical protein
MEGTRGHMTRFTFAQSCLLTDCAGQRKTTCLRYAKNKSIATVPSVHIYHGAQLLASLRLKNRPQGTVLKAQSFCANNSPTKT